MKYGIINWTNTKPADRWTRPFRFVLRMTGNNTTPYVTHMQTDPDTVDNAFHHGHYVESLDKANESLEKRAKERGLTVELPAPLPPPALAGAKVVKLLAHDGDLYIAHADIADKLMREHHAHPVPEMWSTPMDHNPILMYEHPGGDHDTVHFPNPNKKHLRGALYDAREMGLIPDVHEVLLPDGTVFKID